MDPVSETLSCSVWNTRQQPKTRNPVITCVTDHQQSPLELMDTKESTLLEQNINHVLFTVRIFTLYLNLQFDTNLFNNSHIFPTSFPLISENDKSITHISSNSLQSQKIMRNLFSIVAHGFGTNEGFSSFKLHYTSVQFPQHTQVRLHFRHRSTCAMYFIVIQIMAFWR
jgi:hypothetical protein